MSSATQTVSGWSLTQKLPYIHNQLPTLQFKSMSHGSKDCLGCTPGIKNYFLCSWILQWQLSQLTRLSHFSTQLLNFFPNFDFTQVQPTEDPINEWHNHPFMHPDSWKYGANSNCFLIEVISILISKLLARSFTSVAKEMNPGLEISKQRTNEHENPRVHHQGMLANHFMCFDPSPWSVITYKLREET